MTDPNPEPFVTLAGRGEGELIVERSRFIGMALEVSSVEEALAFVAEQKREHYDSRHVCYGLKIGRGAQGIDRSNDDGEPARTGGYPLWQILDGEQIINAMLVVIRYYGGIKLGTGGLARAYREAGRLALADAGTQTLFPENPLDITVPYGMLDKLQHTLAATDAARVVDTTYTEDVTLHLAVRAVDEADLRAHLAGILQRDPDDL